ncbi:MAG: putative thiamine transport system ATP-binding protein [Psychromonas sp.]|jgi:putative thiamine transport system ATP-binding protein|uniref:ATP-binding cassette domain-containing protein n=1 Tax=Psychromonas sp. TaxID=1884585 RepID=UPI0039E3D3DF
MSLELNRLSIYENRGSTEQAKVLISDFSYTVDNGEILTLMGPSGCGKSTLLSVIAGFLSPDFSYTGELYLQKMPLTNIKPEDRKIGVLFQDDLLFPHLSVCENLMLALPNTVKGKQRRVVAQQTLAQLNLSELANKSPQQTSGGQKARISVMRLLLAQPQAVLLDEPFSKLDKPLRRDFRDWLFDELKQRNLPTILVTHDGEDSPHDGTTLDWPWTQKDSLNA